MSPSPPPPGGRRRWSPWQQVVPGRKLPGTPSPSQRQQVFPSLWRALLSRALPREGPPSLALMLHPCVHGPRGPPQGPSRQVCHKPQEARGRRKPVISPLAETHRKDSQCCHSYNKQQAAPREGKRDGAVRGKIALVPLSPEWSPWLSRSRGSPGLRWERFSPFRLSSRAQNYTPEGVTRTR